MEKLKENIQTHPDLTLMDTQREIKFKVWDKLGKIMFGTDEFIFNSGKVIKLYDEEWFLVDNKDVKLLQYTGLKDKNGNGLTEVYEGDIISIDGTLKGNIYENDKKPTDIIIPQLGTKAWGDAYKEAVERGYDYS
jgi:hypothetical protein